MHFSYIILFKKRLSSTNIMKYICNIYYHFSTKLYYLITDKNGNSYNCISYFHIKFFFALILYYNYESVRKK